MSKPPRKRWSNDDLRSGQDRRSNRDVDRSAENTVPYWSARFGGWHLLTTGASTIGKDVGQDVDRRKGVADRRIDNERRGGRDRRCGYDTRSEIERFLQGERRSGLDRRSRVPGGYQTFKKARTFARSLGLKSARKWDDYVKSGMKPDNIPAAPHEVYVNDGWAGWNDWLGR